MKTMIIVNFMFSSFLFFLFVFRRLFYSEQRLEKRMKKYLAVSSGSMPKNQFNLLLHFQLTKQKIRQNMLTKEKNNKLEVLLARAGVPLKPEEYILFQWIATGLSSATMYLVFGQWFFLLIGAIVGFFFPKWYLKRKQRQRIAKFNDYLPDMITTIVGSLRAGFSFPQALKAVTEEASSPIKDEMEAVLKEMQYGSSIEDALNDLKERMPSEDLDLMIQAILIQRQVGGNLATVLDKIVQTIRDRTKIHRQISTLTAQGRLSGIVIGLLPIILAFVLFLIEPDYIGTLFQNPIGIGLVIAGGVSGMIGFLLIRKITSIEV